MTFVKLLTLGVLCGILLVTQAMWFNVGQPEATTTLAMQQFADPSLATDTALRNVQSVSYIFQAAWGLLGILGLVMFIRPIKNLFSKGEDK